MIPSSLSGPLARANDDARPRATVDIPSPALRGRPRRRRVLGALAVAAVTAGLTVGVAASDAASGTRGVSGACTTRPACLSAPAAAVHRAPTARPRTAFAGRARARVALGGGGGGAMVRMLS